VARSRTLWVRTLSDPTHHDEAVMNGPPAHPKRGNCRHVGGGGRMIKVVQNFPFSPSALHAPPQTSTVQVSNRTTGAAMILLKKCDVNNRLPVSRNQSRPSFSPVGQAGRADFSEIEPDRPRAGRRTFVEDFTREHSLFGLHFTSIEVSGNF
jgi:hypothetical protein